MCLCAGKIKVRHGCVCVCHDHSPVGSFLCVYVSICMLTPLNDCDYIRQYFIVNCEVLCIINGIVFLYIYTSCNLLSSPRKEKKCQALSRLQERFSCTHAALNATGVLISSVCDESS